MPTRRYCGRVVDGVTGKEIEVIAQSPQEKPIGETELRSRRAGVAQQEKLRGKVMATYMVAEAEDGYRVVFSLAELDSGILDSEVIVADTMEGANLATKEGPLKIVAPHEKRPARWVRMLKSITVVTLP